MGFPFTKLTDGFIKPADHPLDFSYCAVQIFSSFMCKSWTKVMNDIFPIELVGSIFFRVVKFGLSFLGTERSLKYLTVHFALGQDVI